MRWLFQNVGERLRHAFQNPGYALRSLWREATLADERFLSGLTNVPATTIRRFLDEPLDLAAFAQSIKSAEADFRDLEIQSANLHAKKVLAQYAAVRALRPNLVVETGIANGVSSAYLLLALHLNGQGALYSIGLDDAKYLAAGRSLGWVVPDWLRPRWKVMPGDSREILPKLLAELKSIDVFIHDSLHTYEHMIWEFRQAYPYLRSGGLLLSDDAAWNSAFADFAREAGAPRACILRGVGFLAKPTPTEQGLSHPEFL